MTKKMEVEMNYFCMTRAERRDVVYWLVGQELYIQLVK